MENKPFTTVERCVTRPYLVKTFFWKQCLTFGFSLAYSFLSIGVPVIMLIYWLIVELHSSADLIFRIFIGIQQFILSFQA